VTASNTAVNRVAGNLITRNLIGVFLDDTTDNLVASNTITGNSSTGITMLGNVTMHNVVQGNTISSNGTGVYLERAQNNSITGNNQILNNISAGVYLFDQALGNVVQGNTIKGNRNYGIFVYNSAGNAESIRTAKNKFGRNRIANFREFTGPVRPRM